MQTIQRALLSVSDKTGIVDFARGLAACGIELISTGGTARLLRDAWIPVRDVAEVTGFPEIMDGRVKTLHPRIHGGLLGRRGTDDALFAQFGIPPIDLLVVNLYPFQKTIATAGVTDAEAIEQIDVGGPAMLRAAAKNHAHVAVAVDPAAYSALLERIRAGGFTLAERREMSARAFAHTAEYDAAITQYLSGDAEAGVPWPRRLQLRFDRVHELRYGENPHQRAAFYAEPQAATGTLATARQLQGKELSFNNIADADAALACVKSFAEPACVIVKHANPCGVALGTDLLTAYARAFQTDTTSAFGGIIAFNRELDPATAMEIVRRQFAEVVLAPSIHPVALTAFAAKPNIRVLECGTWEAAAPAGWDLRRVDGGMLVQDNDREPDAAQWRTVTRHRPDENQERDLRFAWQVVKFVKSNAIVYCRHGATLGIGAGQMSRIDSARIAAWKAQDAGLSLVDAVMASDAFFPFRDSVDAAAQAGIRAIVQPGGSLRDAESVAAADELDIAMVFTGVRHFRH